MNSNSVKTDRPDTANEQQRNRLLRARSIIVLNVRDLGAAHCQHTLQMIDAAIAAQK